MSETPTSDPSKYGTYVLSVLYSLHYTTAAATSGRQQYFLQSLYMSIISLDMGQQNYRVRQNKVAPPKVFLCFPFGILIRNFTGLFTETLCI